MGLNRCKQSPSLDDKTTRARPQSCQLQRSQRLLPIATGVTDVRWLFPRLVWMGGGCHANRSKDLQSSSHSLRRSRHLVSRLCWMSYIVTCLFLCLTCNVSPVLSQDAECTALTDCHPSSEDLLSLNAFRSIEVSSTCGDNITTVYRKSSQTFEFDDYYCNASAPHPADNMLDKSQDESISEFEFENPVFQTYWQSELTISSKGQDPMEEYVVFNITNDFLIRFIRIIFVSPHITSQNDDTDMRPLAMAIDRKSEETDGLWEAWRYYAKDCAATFSGVQIQTQDGSGPDYDGLTTVCIQEFFSGHEGTNTNWGYGRQQVVFNPSVDYNEEFAASAALQRHFLASAIRIRLVIPSDPEPLSSYYAIADLEVDGQCACFGHAGTCTGVNNAHCECFHRTMGENCEECEPLFNNKPWRIGAHGKANACEDCQCNNHADSCHYDNALKYGVCDDCRDNTAGDKCDFCVDFYYVNPDKDFYANSTEDPGECSGNNGTSTITYSCDSWCIPCNCSTDGATLDSQYNCANFTGQCECKTNVMGRRCDQCNDTFWNLTFDNPDGCVACDCDPQGTFDSSNMCDKDSGTCICKDNTQGVQCDQCKTGYFNLTIDNPQGCTACDCDPGGSTDLVCPVDTGQCSCRSHIGGRMCELPEAGYFVPRLDHLTYEAEFSPNASDFALAQRETDGGDTTSGGWELIELPQDTNLRFTEINVPATQRYQVVLRYQNAGTWNGASVTLTPSDLTLTQGDQYECSGDNKLYADSQTVEGQMSAVSVAGVVTLGDVCLSKDAVYQALFNPGIPEIADQKMELDSLVLIPHQDDLPLYQTSDDATQSQILSCYSEVKGRVQGSVSPGNCSQYEYELMAELYDGAIECSCESLGATSLTCEGRGGQCLCRDNVVLRTCSQCKTDHYGYDTGDGCTACNCDSNGSLSPSCNETGDCDCKVNVTGQQCQTCIQDHYGLFMNGPGCVECQCNLDYSYNNTCEDSGQCPCKPGIGQLLCEECQNGFYNLTMDGCTSCDCDPNGSSDLTCFKDDGDCQCKTQAQGEKCDQCPQGFFGLGDWGNDGCLSCFCSGHSNNCSSSTGWYRTRMWNSWNLLDGQTATQGLWGGVDSLGNPVDVLDMTEITGTTAQEVLRMINSDANLLHRNLYFKATQGYLGDKRSAYGQTLSFTLSLTLPEPDANSSEPVEMYPEDEHDVILTGLHSDYELVADLSELPGSNRTSYTFKLHEDAWKKDSNQGVNPTYVEMLEVLAALESILIRAKYTNTSGASVTLYAAQLYYAVNYNTNDTEVNNVEQCSCPPQYMGQFCEQCAAGYKRAIINGGSYEECVTCDCNGHESDDVKCEPESGVCNCTHYTTGDHCQRCIDGYYGDATTGTPGDCQPCRCPGNVVEGDANVFATTCELSGGTHVCNNCTEGHGGDHCEYCLDQWYGVPEDPQNNGGQCVPCLCNKRADTCNSTSGWCEDCRNNTAGKECEICAQTYYGNAMLYDCKECNCNNLGATGECNPGTGECVCHPNVQGFSCDECRLDTYNYESGEGCSECGCHPIGALGTSCNKTSGQCTCRSHVTGRRCDLCEATYWNINDNSGCDTCDCEVNGTATVSEETFGICDLETGQCQCAREGIIGRTCDMCAKGTKVFSKYIEGLYMVDYTYVQGIYVGVYPECELCGECYDSWAKKVDGIGQIMEAQYLTALDIWSHYGNLTFEEVDPVLIGLRDNLTSVQSSIETAQDTVEKLDYLQEGFDAVTTTATELGTDLNEITGQVNVVTDLQAETGRFDGRVDTDSGTLTPQQMLARTEETQREMDEAYSQASESWASIQNMTDVLTQSNGSVAALKERVADAMTVLDEAKSLRQSAETILYGEFLPGFTNNSISLTQSQEAIDDLDRDLVKMRDDLETADDVLRSANVTLRRVGVDVGAQGEDIQQSLEESEKTRFNATQAQRAAETAQTATNGYKDLANSAKTNMTGVLEDTVLAVRALENVTKQIATGNDLATEVDEIDLRPLDDLRVITTAIEGTTVSQAQVDEVFDKAEEGLAVAEEALDITKEAADASYRALEKVRGIQANLQDATLLKNHTETLLNATAADYQKIETIITQATDKASSAVAAAETTEANLASLEQFMETITTCFQDKVTRTQAAKEKAQAANETLYAAKEVQKDNKERIDTLSTQTPGKKAELEAQYQELKILRSDMDTLQAELDAAEGITNLGNLQNEVSAQITEMSTLSQDLNALEDDLDDLLNDLDLLDPDSAYCRHN